MRAAFERLLGWLRPRRRLTRRNVERICRECGTSLTQAAEIAYRLLRGPVGEDFVRRCDKVNGVVTSNDLGHRAK